MNFTADVAHLSRILGVLLPDTELLRDGKTQIPTYTRLAAKDGALRIRFGQGEMVLPLTVEQEGVLFLRTSALRRMLNTFTGKTMPMKFEFVPPNRMKFGHRDEVLLRREFAHYPVPSEAPIDQPPGLSTELDEN